MVRNEGRAIWPSLCILGAGLSLLAASLYTERWFHWTGVALLLLAWAPWRAYPTDNLGILVGLYCAWLLGSALLVTPVYSAESLYQPLMLFGGFTALAAAAPPARDLVFRMGIALASMLVLLGLLQYFLGVWDLNDIPNRASGTFMTPNTLGTAINLFLAPMAALYLVRGSSRWLALALWLFAGLVATESRGAMLAFLAGLGFIAVMVGSGALLRRGMTLLAGLAAVWLVVVGAARAAAPLLRAASDQGPTVATWTGRATWDRMDIYAATLQLIMDRPLAGAGANMFFPLFETLKPDSLRGFDYYYAHCDYLQIWLEFGLAGLIMLVLIVATSLLLAWRSFRRTPDDPVPLVCGAALATCFAHAVVDFPLYVPFILMIAGGFLGVLSRHCGRPVLSEAVRQSTAAMLDRLTPSIRATLALAVLAWLSQPMIAEIAVHRSLALLARGDVRDALYWQSVAQRFEPRHPAHYWAEAMIWREQLALARNPLFAAEADALFVKGMGTNPYDVANLLGRAALHRRYPDLLKQPAAPAEVLTWARHAVELRPQHGGVQAEYARALAWAGRVDEARALAHALSGKYPNSESVRRLAREL